MTTQTLSSRVATTSVPTYAPGSTAGIVPAAGLPGSTSGAAVAAGYVGQSIQINVTTFANVPGANSTWGDLGGNGTYLTLTPGVWSLSMAVSITVNGSNLSAPAMGIGSASGSSSSGLIQGVNFFYGATITGGSSFICVPTWIQSVSTSTNYYGKIFATYTSGVPAYIGNLTATRIA